MKTSTMLTLAIWSIGSFNVAHSSIQRSPGYIPPVEGLVQVQTDYQEDIKLIAESKAVRDIATKEDKKKSTKPKFSVANAVNLINDQDELDRQKVNNYLNAINKNKPAAMIAKTTLGVSGSVDLLIDQDQQEQKRAQNILKQVEKISPTAKAKKIELSVKNAVELNLDEKEQGQGDVTDSAQLTEAELLEDMQGQIEHAKKGQGDVKDSAQLTEAELLEDMLGEKEHKNKIQTNEENELSEFEKKYAQLHKAYCSQKSDIVDLTSKLEDKTADLEKSIEALKNQIDQTSLIARLLSQSSMYQPRVGLGTGPAYLENSLIYWSNLRAETMTRMFMEHNAQERPINNYYMFSPTQQQNYTPFISGEFAPSVEDWMSSYARQPATSLIDSNYSFSFPMSDYMGINR